MMEQKLEAIKRLDKGERLQKVADDCGVGWATVGDWKKKRLEIKNGVHQELQEDNAPMHPHAEELLDGDIKAMFLPPNVTAIWQPMNQGILETSERNYCRKLLSTMIEEIAEGHDMIEI
ncbi:hypothetical protein PR048_021729 [Dryococelus australis]|uniref:Transposase n=1 Tax=Dryococelus australis TaxID=614101 RepID=A0ABQ9GZ07_9NEOP|nr:hypothetical protein PR048_021729 [Dryococelus australis]